MSKYIIYLLINSMNNKTYVGITVNPPRRIRQHNCELKGGAKYTSANKGNGEWLYYGYIDDVDKSKALSIEKRIKIKSKKMCGKTPLDRRINAINILLIDYPDLKFTYS